MMAVGDPARPPIGRAVLGTLLVSAVFLAVTWAAKEVPALSAQAPWREDPYDAFVSFAILFVPLVAGLCALRVPLCRRDEPLPARRALDLLRASRTLVALMLVTLAAEWAAVAAGGGPPLPIALAGVLTVLVLGAAAALLRAPLRQAEPDPDWLADALALCEREAARLGPHATRGLGALRRAERRVRRHPLRTAAGLAVASGAAVAALQAVAEGYAPGLALLVCAVGACGMFAFLAIAGAHLRLVARSGAPTRAARAGVAACASVPFALAFRDAVLPPGAALAQLALLLVAAAAVTGGFALAVPCSRPASDDSPR